MVCTLQLLITNSELHYTYTATNYKRSVIVHMLQLTVSYDTYVTISIACVWEVSYLPCTIMIKCFSLILQQSLSVHTMLHHLQLHLTLVATHS